MKLPAALILIVCAFVVGFIAGRGFREPAPAAPPPAPAPAAPAAARLTVPPGQAAIGFLDMVSDKPVYHVSNGETLNISGWAACTAGTAPVSKLQILVDKKVVADTEISFSRPDVATAYGKPEFERSGWKTAVPVPKLAPGTHQLAARALCGEAATLLPAFQLIVSK